MSSCGKWAKAWPDQSLTRPGCKDSRLRLNWPISTKRSPQPGGGVASRRSACCRDVLRITRSTSRSVKGSGFVLGGAGAALGLWPGPCQCSCAPRTTTSRWLSSQSAAGESWPEVGCQSIPAICHWPLANRRSVSSGASSTSWSSLPCTTDCRLSATCTLGRCRPGRPCGSCSSMSLSSKDGTQPVLWAETPPMRTGTPRDCRARLSRAGRNSAIRGTIQKCSVAQARPKTSPATSKPHKTSRTTRASQGRSGASVGGQVGEDDTNV